MCAQHTEIVLTSHPTQISRRTLQYKHNRIVALLAENDRSAPGRATVLGHCQGTMPLCAISARLFVWHGTRPCTAAIKLCNDLCRSDLNDEERERLISDLVREITALWQTDELRRQKPSALDGTRCLSVAASLMPE